MCYNESPSRSRVITEGRYFVQHDVTVRQLAKVFGMTRTTVYTDITKRLVRIDPQLAKSVRECLQRHIEERSMRGGMATRKMFAERERVRSKL